MPQQTPLHERHVAYGGKMVDFAGWSLPIHYGSQVDEHHAVRRHAGLFDVSHMVVTDVEGRDALSYFRHLLANDVARLSEPGRALYSCLLNHDGGVLDDLIVYYRGPDRYRLVTNAATRSTVLHWMAEQAGSFAVTLHERPELAMMAVQGPEARDRAAAVLPADWQESLRGLKRFQALDQGDWFVARTGYTGEDGFELILPAAEAPDLWDTLIDQGVQPAGLGARDTLRLEAGLNLYGNDMDTHTTPLEAGLDWTVAWEPEDRIFLGRPHLEEQRRHGVARRLVGLVLEGRGVLRPHQPLHTPHGSGQVTSGTYAPTLERSIGLGQVPVDAETVEVEIRGKRQPVRLVKPPFVRGGRARI